MKDTSKGTCSDGLQEEIRQVRQALVEGDGDVHCLRLNGRVGCIARIVQQRRQPPPVALDHAVQRLVAACSHRLQASQAVALPPRSVSCDHSMFHLTIVFEKCQQYVHAVSYKTRLIHGRVCVHWQPRSDLLFAVPMTSIQLCF